VTVKANATGKRAKVKLYDLSHWSRQQPDAGRDGRGGLDKKERFRLIEGDLDLPQNIWNICHASMLQDSLVFFSICGQHSKWSPRAQGILDVFSFW